MTVPQDIDVAITDYRVHFDAIYVAGIPQLLNDEGVFLSFLAVITATEALAGLFGPGLQTGDRFKAFVASYFPAGLKESAADLWKMRNAMVHSFNPGPYGLTHHASRVHLTAPQGVPMLNAEDFYAALLTASAKYFAELSSSDELKQNFALRVADLDGGAPEQWTVEYIRDGAPPNKSLERTRDG